MKRFIAFLFILFSFNNINAQIWDTVGNEGFSAGVAYTTSIAINSSGTPYVVYSDVVNGQKATVVKFNGTSWVTVGSAGFSPGEADWTSIAIDTGGTPYVAYSDHTDSGKVTVMKFNGTNWVTVGSADFSAWTELNISLAIDTGGTPFVVYSDYTHSQKATVMKYNGSSWVTVGSPGFSTGGVDYTSIAINNSGTPYIAYVDVGDGDVATVMKFNGTSWVIVGSAGFSAGETSYTSIAIDGSGTPYVVYEDESTSADQATVMKFNGTSWVIVGSADFSASVIFTSIAIDTGGTPYIAYNDAGGTMFPFGANVKKFNGTSWVTVGNAGFSAGGTVYTTIAINNSGTPYVAYMDAVDGSKATVMSLEISPVTGINNVCQSATITLSDISSGGNWSSSNTSIATVSTILGIVTGITSGTTIISYTVYGISATITITVNPLPDAGTITGTGSVCAGSVTSLSNITTGGIWSSGTASIAIIGSTGIVNGVSAGTATISYSVTNGCGTAVATQIVTVNPLPVAGTITGTASVCTGSATSLSNITTGGIWSSGTTGIATVGSSTGIVNGVSTGTSTISYSVTNGCGTTVATQIVTVNPLPNAGSITGSLSVCADSSITLADGSTGGIWSSSNTTIATVGGTGVVNGITSGSATISYSVTNSCGTATATEMVTVIDCATGVNNIPASAEDITIYPNPTQNTITITAATPIHRIIISNLIGQEVFSGTYNSNSAVISLAQLPNGLYVVKINDYKVYKVLKQ